MPNLVGFLHKMAEEHLLLCATSVWFSHIGLLPINDIHNYFIHFVVADWFFSFSLSCMYQTVVYNINSPLK